MIIAFLIAAPIGLWLGDKTNRAVWKECYDERIDIVAYLTPNCVYKRAQSPMGDLQKMVVGRAVGSVSASVEDKLPGEVAIVKSRIKDIPTTEDLK